RRNARDIAASVVPVRHTAEVEITALDSEMGGEAIAGKESEGRVAIVQRAGHRLDRELHDRAGKNLRGRVGIEALDIDLLLTLPVKAADIEARLRSLRNRHRAGQSGRRHEGSEDPCMFHAERSPMLRRWGPTVPKMSARRCSPGSG